MHRRITVLALCAAAALVAGCRDDTGLRAIGSAPPAGGVPTAGPGTPPAADRPSATPPRGTATRRATPPTPPTPPAAGPLVVYQRSGGIAGLMDEMSVEHDGGYRITRRGKVVARGTLTAAELSRLRGVLADSHFRDIPVASGREGADLLTYVVAYDGYAVTAMDLAVPPALAPVLDVLDDLLARHAG